ncbi:hypothetical protein ABIF26_006512 [Bradyrhizobium elkanii]|uniref:hypothetical protein n=1 Tax=Bradyrhizobium elkanii TaxID=29448 RepID=UPI0035112AFA
MPCRPARASDRLWGSIGGGGSYSWAGGRYTVFGEATYRASLQDAGDNHSYKGTARPPRGVVKDASPRPACGGETNEAA